jgi:ribosome assembly protein RRB1
MSTSKRPRTPENGHEEPSVLKSGQRPTPTHGDDPAGVDFEDEFEDEFESEDEIMEAGVDGRPDGEREAEEGVCLPPEFDESELLTSWT